MDNAENPELYAFDEGGIMKTIEIRIKRTRTQTGTSVWEALESWAKMEGRTMPGAIEHLLNNSKIFREYLAEIRNPGRETT